MASIQRDATFFSKSPHLPPTVPAANSGGGSRFSDNML
jgi:hypothetical protein